MKRYIVKQTMIAYQEIIANSKKEAIEVERYNLLNPDKINQKSHIEKCLSSTEGPIVSASDYIRLNSDQIRPFTRKSFYSFGTDGYGRSDTRKNLRKFFEVDKEHIVAYSLSVLAKEQLIPSKYASEAMKKYNIDPNKTIPTKIKKSKVMERNTWLCFWGWCFTTTFTTKRCKSI